MPSKDKAKIAKYQKTWYEKNKVKHGENVRKNKLERLAWVRGLGLKCKVCREDHPSRLDFHHRDPKQKYKGVMEMARDGYSEERILKEIKKCDVLCSNCHRYHHFVEDERRVDRVIVIDKTTNFTLKGN